MAPQYIPQFADATNEIGDVQSQSPLLLLDEVSAHLDKDRRKALYEEISALNLQAWMTGTEEELFSEFSDRAQYLSVLETNGTSQIIKKT